MSAVSGNALSAAFRFEYAVRGCRVLEQFLGRAPWPAQQLATAIRAGAVQLVASAPGAERALERADVRLRRITREIAIAAFAVRTKLQHGFTLPAPSPPCPSATATRRG